MSINLQDAKHNYLKVKLEFLHGLHSKALKLCKEIKHGSLILIKLELISSLMGLENCQFINITWIGWSNMFEHQRRSSRFARLCTTL